MLKVNGFGFKSKEIRATSNIETLREYYEKLLLEYETLIGENVKQDMKLYEKKMDCEI